MTPKTHYVSVRVDDEEWLGMTLTESYTKHIADTYEKKYGGFFGFEDQYFLLEGNFRRLTGKKIRYKGHPWGLRFTSTYYLPFRALNASYFTKSTNRYERFSLALEKLRGYKHGHFNFDEVFDVEKYANYLASTSIWGCLHGNQIDDIIWFYDVDTGLFEPTNHDHGRKPFILKNYKHGFLEYYINIFASSLFRTYYDQALRRIIASLDRGALQKRIRKIEKVLYGETLGDLLPIPRQNMKNLAIRLRLNYKKLINRPRIVNLDKTFPSTFGPVLPDIREQDPRFFDGMVVHYYQRESSAYLELINSIHEPITVSSVQLHPKKGDSTIIYGPMEVLPGLSAKDRIVLEVPPYKSFKDKYVVFLTNENIENKEVEARLSAAAFPF